MIKYKQGKTNKLADMLSRPPTSGMSFVCVVAMRVLPTAYHLYAELYGQDDDFKKFVTEALDSEGSRGASARTGSKLGPSIMDSSEVDMRAGGEGTNGREASARAESRREGLLYKGGRLCVLKGADLLRWI